MFRFSAACIAAAVLGFQVRATAQSGSPIADVEAALKRLDVAAASVHIDPADLDLFDRQPPRSPMLDWAMHDPFKLLVLPGFMDDQILVGDATDVASKALANLSRWQGKTVRRNLVGDPLERARKLAAGDSPVVGAIERVYTLGGGKLPDDVREGIKTNLTGSPLELQQKIAVLIHTMCDAHEWAQTASAELTEAQWAELLSAGQGTLAPGASPMIEYQRRKLVARAVVEYDYALATVGAEDITYAAADLATLFVTPEEEALPFTPAPVARRSEPPTPRISGGGGGLPTTIPKVTTQPGTALQPTVPLQRPQQTPTAIPNTAAGSKAVQPQQQAKAKNQPDPKPGDRVQDKPERNEGMKNSSAPAPPPLYAREAPKWSLDVPTPLGQISIGTEHKLAASPLAPFLVIDWAGDDTYSVRVGANTAPKQRVSVLIDFGGNDTYANTEDKLGSFGSGQGGVGMVFDFAGNDQYRVTQNGLGYANYGCGVLYDHQGDDKYEAVERAEGCAASSGIGLLIDRAGKDEYRIFTVGQGYGGPAGAGALIDRTGDDTYVANDTEIKYPSPQTNEHNTSLAQGCGSGIRGDYQEGLSIPGGVGLLCDGGGKDSYTCGVFGQGVGYWFGTGVLYDREGDDTYQGQWYAQGASAHFSVGVLIDGMGNDTYSAAMNVTQGAGHDVGLGMFVDADGDDRYTAGGLAWGAGNAAAIGLFIDRAGADKYTAVSDAINNLGYATPDSSGSIRKTIAGTGLFFDLGGRDTYPKDRGGDNRTWSDKSEVPADVFPGRAKGVDMDAGGSR